MSKVYEVNGRKMRLHMIGDLAAAIMKDPITVRKWERYGIIPRAFYRDKHGHRLYTLEEIKAIAVIVEEERIQTGVAFRKTRFTERVKAAWEEIRQQMPRQGKPDDVPRKI